MHAVVPLLLVHALSKELARGNGAVVALADAGVTRPFVNHVAYLTAKGALVTGLRALAVELAPEVRVNLVALGIVADPEADADPLRTHRLATRSPLGRFGTSEEVVHAVLALLDATWSTGEIWGIRSGRAAVPERRHPIRRWHRTDPPEPLLRVDALGRHVPIAVGPVKVGHRKDAEHRALLGGPDVEEPSKSCSSPWTP